MMMAMLVMPSSGHSSPAGVMILAQRFPMLGEFVVMVSWVSGQKEDDVIAVAKRHKL
jgi:hypothetical protein